MNVILKNGAKLLFATHNLVLASLGEGENLRFVVWNLNPDGGTERGDYFPVRQNGPPRQRFEAFTDALQRFAERLNVIDRQVIANLNLSIELADEMRGEAAMANQDG